MSRKSSRRTSDRHLVRQRRWRRTLTPLGPVEPRPVEAYVMAWEDSCLPVELRFGPPLMELGQRGPFEYHWQLLTVAFSLPDPAAFPPLSGFSGEETAELRRFITVCKELAGSAAARHYAGMVVNASSGAVAYEPLPDATTAFESLATQFRQLHSPDVNGPGFDSVSALLQRHALRATDDRAVERIGMLAQWMSARQSLRERPLKNLVARSMLRRHRRQSSEANYDDVRPDEVFARWDFGRLLAAGRHCLDEDAHVFMVSALGLCHLYFGYAVVVQAALGAG